MGYTRKSGCAAWSGAAAVAASMVLGAAGALAPIMAGAQDFPYKLVRIVVPNSAGTILDLLSRIMAPDMAKSLGQAVEDTVAARLVYRAALAEEKST